MRGLFRTLIAGAAIAALARCSDSATGPRDAAARGMLPGGRPSLDLSGSHYAGYRTATLILTSAGGTFSIGDLYTLNVPDHAVCVPTSSYEIGRAHV